MHGAFSKSFFHLRAQADVDKRMMDGLSIEIIIIPTSIYHGLFLNMALTSMIGNKLIDRIFLIFTQQRSYLPTSWIRKVPQRQIHLFTILEIIQLFLFVCVGISAKPFVELSFPLITFLYISLRLWILPLFFTKTTYL